MPAWQSWFLPGGTHLSVTKNELPSGIHCGTVCGSFLRTGKSMTKLMEIRLRNKDFCKVEGAAEGRLRKTFRSRQEHIRPRGEPERVGWQAAARRGLHALPTAGLPWHKVGRARHSVRAVVAKQNASAEHPDLANNTPLR